MKQMPGWRSRLHCLWALIGLVVVMDANAVPGAVTYVYDDAGRLRNTSFVCAATTYVLDAAGNRTSVQATTSNTVQFGAATYSVSEANASVTISVLRSCGSSAAVSVGYTLGGTATPTTDYTVSGTLSWAAGDAAPKSLTLTTQDNTVYAPNKTAILTLSAPTGGASIGSPSTTTVTIVENDPQPVPGAVQFTASSLSVSEGTAHAQLTLTRAGAAGAVPAASVICTPANGTAVGGSDFTAGAQSIHWAANDVSNKTCSIPILNDTIFESSETFTVALSAPTGGMTLGSPTTSTVTITDNDGISFSIANVAVNEAAGTATLTVTKTGVTSLTHAVNYASASGTAVSGADFTAVSGTLTFAPAEMTKTFTVAITNDTVYEGTETFALHLSAPTNGATLGTASATVTLQDNDPAPSFSINSVSVNEGAGTATLTVTKSGGTALSHAVNYATANGTASAGSDYTAASGTLTFAGTDTSKTFTVAIANDTVYEGNETFAVNLSAPTHGAVIGTGSATVTLQDNDPAPSFAVSNVSVSEAAGTATITVTKSGSTALSHAVNYATANGTASAGSDYTAASGTLSFTSAETSKTFTVAIANDTVFEGTETFAIHLSAPTHGATLSTASATVTITDNDPAPSFSINSVSVNEGAGTATLTVTKSGGTALTHAVNYATANGTATAGSDYTAASGTLSFTFAETSKTFTVAITNDTVYEGNETFAINLSAPTNGAVIGTGSATVTLQDNDPAPSFSINSVSVNETAGSATLTVTKSGSTVLTHAVSYASANGSATAGADYTAVSGTLSFTSGETSKTITVSILDDTLYESSESFSVNLSAPTQGASLGTASGTVTLLSNDPPPSLSVYGGSVNESAGTVTVSVEKSGSTGLTHAVNYTTVSGTAVSGADFTATSGTLTFAPAETIKTFTVAIINDSVAESTEYFSIQLSAPTNGATLGAGLGVIGIVDDDIPAVPGSVQFSGVSPSASVLEPVGSVTLTLSRTGASGPFGAASVVCATSNGTAIAGSDYVAVSQTITWAAGDSSPKSCVVPIIDDTQFELHCASNPNFPQPGEMPIICTRDEYFYVYLSNVSGMSLGSPMSMTITINDGADLP